MFAAAALMRIFSLSWVGGSGLARTLIRPRLSFNNPVSMDTARAAWVEATKVTAPVTPMSMDLTFLGIFTTRIVCFGPGGSITPRSTNAYRALERDGLRPTRVSNS